MARQWSVLYETEKRCCQERRVKMSHMLLLVPGTTSLVGKAGS